MVKFLEEIINECLEDFLEESPEEFLGAQNESLEEFLDDYLEKARRYENPLDKS